MTRTNRRAITLAELLSLMVPALIVLALVIALLAHTGRHDAWNGERLEALDGLVLAAEHLRADLAVTCGPVDPAGDQLAVVVPGAPGLPPSLVAWEHAGTALSRNGAPLRAARVDRARFAWSDEAASVVSIELACAPRLNDPAAATTLRVTAHLPARAAAREHAAWRDR